MAATAKYKAEDLVKLIRQKYESQNNGTYNRYVAFEQVGKHTGFSGTSRWIDVAVFSMWPMDGPLTRSAFEVKVSRQDFLNELRQPEKHQWCKDAFHEFWFVAPKDVVQMGEIPAGAGWMCPHGTKLYVTKQAPRNENPVLDDTLLAAFLRSAYHEMQDTARRVKADGLANDRTYQTALAFQKATDQYLSGLHHHMFYNFNDNGPIIEPETIMEALQAATRDRNLDEERHRIERVAHALEASVTELLRLVIDVAYQGILTSDEYGTQLVKPYSNNYDSGLKALKELAKLPKGRYHGTDRDRARFITRFIDLMNEHRDKPKEDR